MNVTPTINLAYLTLSAVMARQCAAPLATARIGSVMGTGPNVLGPILRVDRPSCDRELSPIVHKTPSANRNDDFENQDVIFEFVWLEIIRIAWNNPTLCLKSYRFLIHTLYNIWGLRTSELTDTGAIIALIVYNEPRGLCTLFMLCLGLL